VARVTSLALLTTSPAIAATDDFHAAWSDHPITIDASLDDWAGRLQASTEVPVSIGIVNDGDFLYLALSSSDEHVARSIFHRGLIVHMRPKNGTELAVEFPLGTPDPQGGHRSGSATGSSDSFLLYEAGAKDGQRIAVDNPFGLEMKAKLDNDTLSYELKVPLHRSSLHPYCLDAADGTKVALEIESPEERSPDRGYGGGGYGGGGGGRHDAGGGSDSGGSSDHHGGRAAPVKIKAKYQLAVASAQTASQR
jgi:hypothetical protein